LTAETVESHRKGRRCQSVKLLTRYEAHRIARKFTSGGFSSEFPRTWESGYRLGKGMRDGKDNRLFCHDESGTWSVLPRVGWSSFCTSTSAAGLQSTPPFSFIVGGTTGNEAAFSTGLDSELSEFGRPMSSAAGGVNSSLEASCAQAVAIWRNAKRAALSRLSPAHRLQFPDNLQQSSADDVITPKRAVVPTRGEQL
jgi:hypothetical protein